MRTTERYGKANHAALPAKRTRFAWRALIAVITAASMASSADEVIAPVVVTTLHSGALEEGLELTGTVTSRNSALLSPRVSGLIARFSVDAGDSVERGELLLELDDALAKLELTRAKAAYEESRARLAENERLRDEARRLLADNHIPRTQVDTAAAQVKVSVAEVARMEAERRLQEKLVERHRLIAPFDGVVSQRLADVGEWVQTGTPVLELVALDAVRVDVQAPQEQYYRLTGDEPARIVFDALPAVDFPARIVARVPVKNPQARTFLVRLELERRDERITPGMSARVFLPIEDPDSSLTAPRDAVLRHADGTATVWLVTGGDDNLRAQRRRVEIGRARAGRVEIVSGLESGSRVVVRGNESLVDGQPVRIVASKRDER